MPNTKYVYLFNQGNAKMRNLLGGKGANLAEMINIGLPIPLGFTITTEACKLYLNDKKLSKLLIRKVNEAMNILENKVNKKFGGLTNPLLVSVRSGASISMPGMMDTILNLGLNDDLAFCCKDYTDERFILDSYRRFIQMFSEVVMKIPSSLFEQENKGLKNIENNKHNTYLNKEELRILIGKYKAIYYNFTKENFPQDPYKQLYLAIAAVFESWNSKRARYYRKHNNISNELGTAVNIQLMVFGNKNNYSGTGVVFTRNPSTGKKEMFGEYLNNAQGEDVVSGVRTPLPIKELKKQMPKVYNELLNTGEILEKHYKDMQDIEFTIEDKKLYLLQTRNGKRSAEASIKILVDMVNEGLLSKEEAIMKVIPKKIGSLLHSTIDSKGDYLEIAKGLPASPGAANGMAVFSANKAERLGKEGVNVILISNETTPDDIHGMIMSKGILTSRGGMTSHAAVVARGMGKPAVCGCSDIEVNLKEKYFKTAGYKICEGDIISINGSTGSVILGSVNTKEPALSSEFKALLSWSDDIKRMSVRANADNKTDALKAKELGAKGIGLTRTEHMFMQKDRLPIMQQMILAETVKERKIQLDKLLCYQRNDFVEIFKVMKGYPVCIRLLDPPLHEFLPNKEILEKEIAISNNIVNTELQGKNNLMQKLEILHESNPMLGHRGCRLAISYPEIYMMQVRAIFLACIELSKEGYEISPEIEIPLVVDVNELRLIKENIIKIAKEVEDKNNTKLIYKVGTMIELPRAALTADKLAKDSDFFSFGTNDLTQTTFGFSRDDAESKFLDCYLTKNILRSNPFVTIDKDSVGRLMDIAVTLGKLANDNIEIGICGEHGGDPESICFCEAIGLDFISCSPYRVPVARVAAAQAVLLINSTQ